MTDSRPFPLFYLSIDRYQQLDKLTSSPAYQGIALSLTTPPVNFPLDSEPHWGEGLRV